MRLKNPHSVPTERSSCAAWWNLTPQRSPSCYHCVSMITHQTLPFRPCPSTMLFRRPLYSTQHSIQKCPLLSMMPSICTCTTAAPFTNDPRETKHITPLYVVNAFRSITDWVNVRLSAFHYFPSPFPRRTWFLQARLIAHICKNP